MSYKTVSEWLGMDVPLHKDKQSALEALSYLWKLDDPAWVEQREQDWKEIREIIKKEFECKKDELNVLENYFKFGKKNGYISRSWLYFFTPYNTVQDAKKVFASRLLGPHEQGQLFKNYIFTMNEFESLPWYQHHMAVFINAFYTDGYQFIGIKKGKELIDLSPPPTHWALMYVKQAVTALKKNKRYASCYDCLGYFKSILPYAKKPKFRKFIFIKINELMDLINASESGELADLNENASKFLEHLKDSKDEILSAWQAGEQ